ncbi:hypothetical protein ACFFX0_08480 [Citricoccus parietis]|uniref:Secreted protein n=1 Tax=Citricoccus parietis TaxID=592307 RepID=A0ABV5FX11_9MICC
MPSVGSRPAAMPSRPLTCPLTLPVPWASRWRGTVPCGSRRSSRARWAAWTGRGPSRSSRCQTAPASPTPLNRTQRAVAGSPSGAPPSSDTSLRTAR